MMATTAEPTPDRASISGTAPDRKVDEPISETISRLVGLARQGDRDAFGELYRQLHAPVARLARFHLRDGFEDAVAETFVRAWVALPRYRNTGAPFVSWLYGIARHVIADELRARRRVEPRSDLPDTAHQEGDDRLALAAAMERLPREQRQVLELKFLLGLRNPEVAAAMGKTVGAVNALQWRALRAMRGMVPR